MKTAKCKIMLFLLVFAAAWPGNLKTAENVFINLGAERLSFENKLEEKVEKHLKKRFNLQKAFVQIEAVPHTSMDIIEQGDTERLALPGVPVAEELMSEREVPALRYFLDRINARIYLSRDFPDEDIPQLRTFVTNLINLDFDRGDRLEIEQTLEPVEVFDIAEFVNSPYIFQFAALFLAFIFFLGPVRSYLSQAKKRMEVVSVRERSQIESGPAGFAGNASETAESGEKIERKHFSFVNKENFSRLMHVISTDTVEVIAVVCEFLPGEFSAEILSQLPFEKKRETIKFMSKVNYLSPGRIKEIENSIKEKVESIVGGDESLFKMFKELDPGEQQEIIRTASEVNRGLSNKLNDYVITFEDILEFEPAQLLSIVRAAGVSIMARAIYGSDKGVQKGLIKKLPSGMSRMLEEELSFLPDLSEDQISQARKDVMKRAYEIKERA